MSGTIGVTCDDLARYSIFTASLEALRKHNAVVHWGIGTEIAAARNQLVRDMEGDWIWFLDDDHSFASDTLEALLARDLPIVAPLVYTRKPPFEAVCVIDDRRATTKTLAGRRGLLKVQSTGTAGLLIRREVLEKMGDPWFQVGRIAHEAMAEDVYFCRRAISLGFDVHVDLDVPLGHIVPGIVWPRYSLDGDYLQPGVRYEIGGNSWGLE